MPDDKTRIGSLDNERINVHEPHELKSWAKHFGVTAEAIRRAVLKVGTSAKEVKRHLGK